MDTSTSMERVNSTQGSTQSQCQDQGSSSSKWDLLTGRGGDPPGLDTCLGSSHTSKVKCPDSEMLVSDPMFLPMSLEDLEWVKRMDDVHPDSTKQHTMALESFLTPEEVPSSPSPMPPPAPRTTSRRPPAPTRRLLQEDLQIQQDHF